MNKKKKILLLSLILVINGIFVFSSKFKWNNNNSKNDIENDEFEKFQFDNLKISDYSPDFVGGGENINITLHQSIVNNTIITLTDLKKSNSFTEPCPVENDFNSSFISVEIDDIKADNFSLVVQNNPLEGEIDCTTTRLTSFSVSTNCYLINASINIKRTAGPTGDIYLYASTWNSVLRRSEPTGTSTTLGTIAPTSNGWLYVDLIDTFLNTSDTDNNTWFLGVVRTSGGGSIQWRYTDDTVTNNNSYAYYSNAGWTYETRDYLLEIGLAPISATPFPQDIGLKINNTQVVDYGLGSGYWISTEELQDNSGILNFTLTSDWYAVSLNITEVQINYTKTDLKAISTFNVQKGGVLIKWNVTMLNGLNFFNKRITNYTTINFTIPVNWNNIKVFNNSINKTNDILIRNLNNGYKNVQVFNAGNGSFWFLNATSPNLLQSVDTYIGSTPCNLFNYSSIVHFNVTFSETISQNDGIINLSVYSPSIINEKLNFSQVYTSFGPAAEISLGDWDISDNVTRYGIFRVQLSWNNNTDAGFLEKNITIIGETNLTLIEPFQNALFNSDQIFNITVYFYDTGVNKPIDGTLSYNFNGGIWQSTMINNGTKGYYNITVDCQNFDPFGPQTIAIRVNQTFYNNKSIDYNFIIIGVSDLVLVSPAQDSSFNSNEIFNITVYYNDTLNNRPINGTIWYNINGSIWHSTTSNNGTVGYYNITVDCSSFDPYGPQSVSLSLNHTYYQNKTLDYTFSINGLSELVLIDPIQGASFTSDQSFNITLYFNDIIKTQPINATMWYSINGGAWFSTTKNNGTAGYYNITVDCSNFDPYGLQSVSISLNHSYYPNKTLDYTFSIYGLSELFLIDPVQGASFTSDQSFNITLYFNDLIKTQPINATMWYSINGGAWFSTTKNNGTAGYYNITIDCSTFDPYGLQSVLISLNQTYFFNKSLSFDFNIIGITELILISPSQNEFFNSNQNFNLIVYFNDTMRNQAVNGTMWYSINGGAWQFTVNNNGTAGYYNLTIDCSTFYPYGQQSVLISLNQTYYQNKTITYNFKVFCLTELTIYYPNQFINKVSDEIFNITIYFNDTNREIGITGSIIYYTVNGTVYNNTYEIGNGYYNITIYNWEVCRDVGYGLIDISINASKTYYYNQSLVFHYYLYNLTTQLIDQDILTVIRSQNATFNVFYLSNDSSPILGAQLEIISINPSFLYTWGDNGDGTYYLELNTINVLGMGATPYTIIFKISSNFNQTQIYTVNLYVLKFNIIIEVIEQPNEVDLGEVFNILLNITNHFNGEPINNLDISIFVDFGTLLWEDSNTTSVNGLVFFKISVPQNAVQVNISIQFNGDSIFLASEIIFSIKLDTDDNVNGDLTNQPPVISIYLILIVGAVGGIGLFVVYKKKRSSSLKTAAAEELKILPSTKSEDQFKAFIQEDIIIKRSIETTKEIDRIIKKGKKIDANFKMLNLDKLKDKIESKIPVTIDKKEIIKGLEKNKTIKGRSGGFDEIDGEDREFKEKLDKISLKEKIEFEKLKNSIIELNKEGLNLLKKGELKNSLDLFKIIRELLRNNKI